MLSWLAERFETNRSDGGRNLRPMEGLRGFAVFMVFCTHFAVHVYPAAVDEVLPETFWGGVFTIGKGGVDLFFVLSGYLIYGSLIRRPQGFWRFMGRRWERIYPAFLAVFALYVVLSLLLPELSKLPEEPAAAALYLLANLLLLPGLFPIDALITVAWSLSYEMAFYLALPVVIAALGLRQWSPATRSILFLATAMIIAIVNAIIEGRIAPFMMFISGVLLYEAMRSPSIPTPGVAIALIALGCGLFARFFPVPWALGNSIKLSIMFVAFFVLCLHLFRSPTSPLGRVFSWTPLRWLGNMSYSYYLLHGLALTSVFAVLERLFAPRLDHPLELAILFAVVFLATLIPTTALFLTIERPLSLTPRRSGRGPVGALEGTPRSQPAGDAPETGR